MAARINPCHGCPAREGCEQRDEFRRRIAGIGARSVTFRCERLNAALRPGRRIVIGTPVMVDHSSYCEPNFRIRQTAVPATITRSHDGKFTCVIDPGHVRGRLDLYENDEPEDIEKYRFRKYLRAQQIIRFLDEPDMPVCRNGRVQRDGTCDAPDGGCYCAEEAQLAQALAD